MLHSLDNINSFVQNGNIKNKGISFEANTNAHSFYCFNLSRLLAFFYLAQRNVSM